VKKNKQMRSLIIGGTRGIGSVIRDVLLRRGDAVFTASRGSHPGYNHFVCSLPDPVGIENDCLWDNLIFAHRYRGDSHHDEFDVMIEGMDNVVNFLMNSFSPTASIVILGSNASDYVLSEQNGYYHSSRSALSGFMRYYAVVLGRKGIRCNMVVPSTVTKPENMGFFSEGSAERKMIADITPLRRMGDAIDVANVVDFFTSPKSTFVTGQSIYVDGGLSSVGQESIARELLGLKHRRK